MAFDLKTIVSGKKLPDFLRISGKRMIGDITIGAILEEQHTDELEITDHPVERGAKITDHSYATPVECVLTCGWTNSSLDALVGAAMALFVKNGKMSKSDYVCSVYQQLLALQKAGNLIKVSTSLRQYDNMLIRCVTVHRDKDTAQALMATATLRELIIVETKATNLSARELDTSVPVSQSLQKNAAATAQNLKQGARSLVSGLPSPGGAVPLTALTSARQAATDTSSFAEQQALLGLLP